MKLPFTLLLCLTLAFSHAQLITNEDFLHRDTTSFLGRTTLGGYGNARFQRDMNEKTATVNLERFVLFVGHKFSKKISLFTELEVEGAKIEGGENGGEVALEQCYVKFSLNANHYIVAGLFLPRIGILNENHLPTQFNGNDRNRVETLVLPTTWRELGIGFYGSFNSLPLSYSIGLVNGLNSAAFEHGSGIREGRFEGRNASANNLALTASLQLAKSNFSAQVSAYCGGSVGLSPRQADSLKLNSGAFGTPVIIGEGNVRYETKNFHVIALATVVSIQDAYAVNRAYANNTPELIAGGYAEVAYNLLNVFTKKSLQQLDVFARFESFNLNAIIPANGINDPTLNQNHLVIGLSYLPIKNVVIKADARLLHTGRQNQDLIINPNPVARPYKQNNILVNAGIGFAF